MSGTPQRKTSVPYHKKPTVLSTVEWQRALRAQWAREKRQPLRISYQGGEHPVFGDYAVENPESRGRYKVALRSKEPGRNFCSCLDFKTNALGTCKHIEAVLEYVLRDKKKARLLADSYRPTYSSLSLVYGATRAVILRIGSAHEKAFTKLAAAYFDEALQVRPDAYDRIDLFIAAARQIDSAFRCYDDAMDLILERRQERARHAQIGRSVSRRRDYLDRLLGATLYPYQKEGVLFAARAGRAIIADEMGLGKTLQALGTAELLKKECGVTRVLIVCPTSLKYQWKSEIEKFTKKSGATVVEGGALARQKQYGAEFYTIASYNAVGADIAAIRNMEPDLVILDEAQRIKNWKTRTAQSVKRIKSPYAVVLTGTPIENKLEELYSIVQFIDPFKLGPLYAFLEAHQMRDESGKVIGYRELHRIREVLVDIMIRRTKKNVLAQLPTRTDKNIFVPLTERQAELHTEYGDIVARLVSKWKKRGFLDEKDRQRLLMSLGCMRMVADSTYILDQETRHDTKVAEVMSILDTALAGDEKVVVFSQWERMTRLVKHELEARAAGFAYLHGGIDSKDRKGLLDSFRDDPRCRVFLSTDAGGVGLNLQSASILINIDLPWNPAVLEQRIGRIHRHGQKRPISVINLVSRGSIEERMLGVLAFKSSLFAGVLDGGDNEIFMGESKFKKFMSSVEEVARASEHTAAIVPTDVEAAEDQRETAEEELDAQGALDFSETQDSPARSDATDVFAAGQSFFESLVTTFRDPQRTDALVSSFIERDPKSGKAHFKIPLDNPELVATAADAIAKLLSGMRHASTTKDSTRKR